MCAVDLVQCCFTSPEATGLIRDGEPRAATSTFTQPLSSIVSCRPTCLGRSVVPVLFKTKARQELKSTEARDRRSCF